MYERFTDRCRRVMMLSNQEALSLNHDYMGVEHLFLGILREKGGVAHQILSKIVSCTDALAVEFRQTIKPGPESVILGKLPQTPRLRQVVHGAIKVAGDAQANYIGTEHLLLALIANPGDLVESAFIQYGITSELVRQKLSEILSDKLTTADGVPLPQTPVRILNYAVGPIGGEIVTADAPQIKPTNELNRENVLNILRGEMESARQNNHAAAFAYLKRAIRLVTELREVSSVPEGFYVESHRTDVSADGETMQTRMTYRKLDFSAPKE